MCETPGSGSCFICEIIAPKCPDCELVYACQDHIAIHRSANLLNSLAKHHVLFEYLARVIHIIYFLNINKV